jgi:hypothetical protein
VTDSVPGGRGDGWRVTPTDRAALLRKYRVLAGWRRAKDESVARIHADAAPSDPKALRTLSNEFPGALRELDVLGLPEILRRIEQLARRARRSTRNGTSDPGISWVPWILAYHALMRAALVAKRAYGRTRGVSAAAMPEVIRTASATAGVPIDEHFLHAVARPPGGRLAVVVLGEMARRFDVPATKISTTLFPPRRPAPYVLVP